MTVMASVLYRLLGVRVGQGYEKAEARTLYRNLVRHSGKITITEKKFWSNCVHGPKRRSCSMPDTPS